MNRADLQTLLDYHYWARDRLLDAIEPLTPEQYTRDLGNSFKSIRDTVAHVHAAEWAWYSRWQLRLTRDGAPISSAYDVMRSVNPAIIPRNHRVEEALAAAEEQGDLSVLERLLAVLASPYETKSDDAAYREPPEDDSTYRTFCGT